MKPVEEMSNEELDALATEHEGYETLLHKNLAWLLLENEALKAQLAAAQPAIEAMRKIEEMATMDTGRYIVEISHDEGGHYYAAELWDTAAKFGEEPVYPFGEKRDTLIEAIAALYTAVKTPPLA